MQTTRRGFLKTAVVGSAATAACAQPPPHSQLAQHPDAAPASSDAHVRLKTIVNGKPHEHEVDGDESTLAFVRERLGLTGCKLGCGHGACGACTMQVDGTPVVTCLLPALALEGKQVTTIEGLSSGGALHPIQRAFMAEDALQCGYCTPGFVVEAAAFHDRWRSRHGTAEPTHQEVADALAGHLCRCGAYPAIYRAVIAACTGKHDQAPDHGPRVDARAKVTGEARYTVDIQREGMLIAKLLRSPHAHARVKKIDWSAALAMPGVFGAIELTKPGNKIRYAGQELVAIAASDEATAEQAIAAVEIEYELLGVAIGREAALSPDAVEIYESKRARKHPPNANEAPLLPETWEGNLRGPFTLFAHHAGKARKRIEAAGAGQGRLVEGSFLTQTQAHTALEPHAAIAEWLAEDRLLVHVSTQAVRHLAEDLAHRYRLRREDVEVRAEYVGGGFGAKAVMSRETPIAVDLARVCGRPVKLVLDRREELTVGGTRPSVLSEVAIAADDEGMPAIRVRAQSDAGVAVGNATTTLVRIMYPQADLDLADYDVITNQPPGCPLRGPGGPPSYFALEQTVDAMAHVQGIDPLQLRKRWNHNPAREQVYAWAERLPKWRDRPSPQSDKGRFRRGVGLAAASWFYFAEPGARVRIDVGPEGLIVSTATQEIGNGVRTVLADVVAAVFGVDPHTIRVEIGTSKSVPGPMAGGSRSATSVGPAATAAALELRDELVELASARLRLVDAKPIAGGIQHRDGTLAWEEAFELAPTLSVTGKRGRDKGGFFLPPFEGVATGRYLSAAVQVSEIEVDTRLGRVRVLDTHAAFDVGKIYSPKLARSQAEGGIVQGIGYALYEERRLDPRDGRLLTGGLEDYRLCGIGDAGDIHVHFIEEGFEHAQGRGVGLGEIVTLAPSATIANAVFDATGWRPRAIPLRPDRVLAGLAGHEEVLR